ncbi:hypothetical protein L218DRAFT_845664, partial [Marasmius fiardii PR-910]
LWMIDEGGRQMFFGVFIFLHLLRRSTWLLTEDNLTNVARRTFGAGFSTNRSFLSSLCHIDVIFILLPVCRNFISIMRRTPLGTVIPFEKNISLHKITGWSIFIWSLVHMLARVVNII